MKTAKQHLIDSIFPLLLALIIGGLAGLGAVFFRWLIGFETSLFWSGEGSFLEQYQHAFPC